MISWLIRASKNRAGTRIGLFTWVWWAWIAIVMVAGDLGFVPDRASMWLILSSYPLILLNRFDRSGPTIEEFREAQQIRAAAKEARYLARRESTVAYRLGRWVGRKRGQREAARRQPPGM
jgi:hypothetical protein